MHRPVRSTLYLLLMLLFAIDPAAAAGLEPKPPEAREPVPDLQVRDLEGKPVHLSDFRGRVVVLNLWATWCVPCREEMPALDRLQAAFPPEKVQVVALSVDRGGDDRVGSFLSEIGVRHLLVLRDPDMRSVRTLGAPGLPATLIIDRKGREVLRRFGIYAWDGEEMKALLSSLLAEAG